jgi:hypothetical protein
MIIALAGLLVSVAVVALHAPKTDTSFAPPEQEGLTPARYFTSLPLVFEANQGQTDAQVHFVARGGGVALFLTSTGYALELCGTDRRGEGVACDVLRMSLLDANPEPEICGLEPLPSVSNYLIGSDRVAWHRGVPHFARVEYEQVYAGIDLVFHGSRGTLEYDFVVAPGVDPDAIRLAYSGAESLSVDAAGNLVVSTSKGELVQGAPVVYQESTAGRRDVAGRFTLDEDGRVGFELGAYDTSFPLTIDPVLSFSTFLGGSGIDAANGIAVDAVGNVYVAGRTESADFPTLDAYDGGLSGSKDAFVVKLSPNGKTLLFSTYLGGSDFEEAYAVGTDRDANVYLAGDTGSSDFPTHNALQKTYGGGRDSFVVKLDASGSTLLYGTYLGGGVNEFARSMAVDEAGEAYVLGHTSSTNFPTASPLQGSKAGGRDLFITHLAPSGLYMYYSTYLGGAGDEDAGGIAIDDSGVAYITGDTNSSDFPTTNASQPSFRGSTDGIVARLHFLGVSLHYATFLGGSGYDYAQDVSVDRRGRAYVISKTSSANFPTKDAYQPDSGGGSDVGVTRLAADGSLELSTFLGGSGTDEGLQIVVDPSDSIYLAGRTSSTNFPTASSLQSQLAGNTDSFVAQFTPNATALAYSTYLGGGGIQYAYGLALDDRGAAYVAGQTNSSDFPTASALQPSLGGAWDAVIAKLTTPLDFFIAATPPIATPAQALSEDRE